MTASAGVAEAPDIGAARHRRSRLALQSLMLASFAIGTGEFVIVGLVPDLARDLQVSVPAAGLLVSVYALSVAFGSPFVALLLASVRPRAALLALMLLFVAGDAACALAPDFHLMMAARILTALAHGAFFGLASVVAARLAPPGRAARAVALMFTGLTLSNVVGVPLGTWIGQMAGWRATFVLVAALAAVSLACMALFLPSGLAAGSTRLRSQLAALGHPRIWLAMLLSTLSSLALFTVLTFLAPLLAHAAGLAPRGTAFALFLFGAGLTLGGLVGGRLADRDALRAIRVFLALDAAVLAGLGLVAHAAPLALAAIFLWGVVAFALVPPLQHLVVAAVATAPQLASTLNQSAFNLGDALGAALGAAILASGASYAALPWAAAAILCAALLPALLAAPGAPSGAVSGTGLTPKNTSPPD